MRLVICAATFTLVGTFLRKQEMKKREKYLNMLLKPANLVETSVLDNVSEGIVTIKYKQGKQIKIEILTQKALTLLFKGAKNVIMGSNIMIPEDLQKNLIS